MGSMKLCLVLFALVFQYRYAEGGLLGAPEEQNNPESFTNVVEPVINEEMIRQNNGYSFHKIIKISKQVVAGMRYIVDFEAINSLTDHVTKCNIMYVQPPGAGKNTIEAFSCEKAKSCWFF